MSCSLHLAKLLVEEMMLGECLTPPHWVSSPKQKTPIGPRQAPVMRRT